MAKSIPALINPTMLVWARTTARLSVEEAAHKMGISAEKLAACEADEAALTFSQLMKAATVYKRPVSLFYLKTPPSGWAPIQDFRRLADVEPGFSPRLTYVIRQARERREFALELRAELNDPIRPYTLTAQLGADIEATGQAIRDYLGVTDTDQQQWKRKAFDAWRIAMENRDVLVFMVPRLPLAEMRGTAIAERELPVILVNGQDRTFGRVFTLLHEFCHLALRQSGVSSAGGDQDDAPNPAVERFCNAAAAAALMPKGWLLNEPLVRQKGTAKTWDNEELEALALRFGVSREAMLRRLLTLGKTTQAFYEQARPSFQAEYDELAEQKSKGGPPQHLQVLSQLGRSFTRLVFEGYHERRLTLRDVANHFNMQVKLVPEMERAAFNAKG
ncbi:ImmA/IrrE family metallo-endopeptidase [Rhodovarius lipocyclicus]|uniref:ImmA/IrrE family metallo-endopeptidase n=1 Tax=Rhodovarius lipocyclicus TaxID=268410 RepID=UPI001358A378|nr:ImmA/IrrE family metallo-endopeptidase [Rhodovarius lipocyclicus]